jgi:hypothetical protein
MQFALPAIVFSVLAIGQRSWLYAVVAGGLAVLAIRSARLSVIAAPSHLVARNLFRTWDIPARRIASFSVEEGWTFSWWLRLPGSRVACRLDNRSVVRLLGTQCVHRRDATDFYGGRATDPPTARWERELSAIYGVSAP